MNKLLGSALMRRRGCSWDGASSLFFQSKRPQRQAASSGSSSTMELDSYAAYSKNQYAAHLLTRDLLSASIERLAERCNLEDADSISGGNPTRRRRMVDLGSADGSSSVETLKFVTRRLQEISSRSADDAISMPLHVTFEEHPASNKLKLQTSLNSHGEWFDKNDIKWDVLMKSFYEPLFDPGTIDFMMSYICLHWLDTTDVSEGGNITEWKSLGGIDDANSKPCLDWTQINETAAPIHIREAWQKNLAHTHLAKFLSLRSRELRPGGELFLVMVGHPHEFSTPSDGGPGPLTRAMRQCIARGEVRRDVLHRTTVPYFLRTVTDVEEALRVAEALETDGSPTLASAEKPGVQLKLVDCRSVPTITKGDDDVLGGAFHLYWSIHSNSLESANPTEEEVWCIKTETRRVFDEIYDCETGIPGSFVACTLRKCA